MSVFSRRRAPREFEVSIGDPWTINGEAVAAASPSEALETIYDIAERFPVSISVRGNDRILTLEMDEYGSTTAIDQRTETSADTDEQEHDRADESGGVASAGGDRNQDENNDPAPAAVDIAREDSEARAEESEVLLQEKDEPDAQEEEAGQNGDLEEEVLEDLPSGDEGPELDPLGTEAEDHSESIDEASFGAPTLGEENPKREPDQRGPMNEQGTRQWPEWVTRKTVVLASSVTGAAIFAALLTTLMFTGDNDEPPGWQTQPPEVSEATEPLTDSYPQQLWSLAPDEADSASWFSAGVVATTDEEITLYSTTSGEQTATIEAEDYDLDEDLAWTAEFYVDGTPAVGLRLADEFTAMTAEGETQAWEIPDTAEVQIYGSTPMLIQSTEDQTTYQALVVGEDDPIDLTPNPELITRAVDQDRIIQIDGTAPLVALNPVDPSNGESGQAVTLTAPTEEATFVRHLDAGHSLALALWEVENDLYLGVHPLETDEPISEAASFVPAPFDTAEDATSWTMGRGMDLIFLGPYAFDLDTGELAEQTANGETFTNAFGPAAVTAPEEGSRSITTDHTQYTETEQIIGYTGRGSLITHSIDGSIVVHGETEGAA